MLKLCFKIIYNSIFNIFYNENKIIWQDNGNTDV